ncbi:MAG: exo-alpha-sialidase [Candidatus Dormibacteraeota bacterium]|nr:exo-alpha-sialidase [Candidatus Dormibacteraeota bacterium]MBV9525321.1 exo-alpha-sialidase [Candidatus Dormibacteraeota bacterium]
MGFTRSARLTGGLGAALLCSLGLAVAARADSPQFTVGVLPQATGVTYGAAAGGRNEDVEPGIGVGGDGVIWVGSNLDVNTSADPRTAVAIAGEDIWKSTDGGQTFQWVAAPFNETSSTAGLGGEDSDLTVAPVKNANGFYNVYATSLYVAASNMAYSQDGGATWTDITLGGIPAQDRPWIAADGACTFYLTYHQLPLFSPIVNKYDVCNLTNIGAGFTLNPVQSTALFTQNTIPGLTNAFGKTIVDNSSTSPFQHNVYVPMEACNLTTPTDYFNNVVGTAEQVPTCPTGVNTEVEIGVSTDGGQTYNDYVVAYNGNGETQVWPTSLGVDATGELYMVWSDNHHGYLSTSTDGGKTWSAKQQIDASLVGTVTYPTVAAADKGIVDVAYYATSAAGDANDLTVMGTPGSPTSAQWHLYWQASSNGGTSFSAPQAVTTTNHTGVLCTMGSACSISGSRNLYDDFGVVISPVTGNPTIAFDADQPFNAPLGNAAVDPYTAYATEVSQPSSSTPEAPVSAALVMGGLVSVLGAAALRRRRSQQR